MSDLGPLIGTPSRLTIRDEHGHIIVKEGEIITQGVIERTQDAGKLDVLRISAGMAQAPRHIEPAGEYEEIGEEEPHGVRPE